MAIAWVQSVSAQGGFGNTVTTAGINTTSGNLVLIDNFHTAAFSSNSDSNGNSWTANSVPEVSQISGSLGRQNYNANITGGAAHTFTGSYGGNGFPIIAATEISGHAASPLDVIASASTPFSTAHSTGATANVGADTKLAVGFMCTNNGQSNTADSWTQRLQAAHGVLIATTAASSGNAYTFNSTSPSADGSIQWVTTWIEAAGGATAKRFLSLLGAGT